MHYFDKKMEEFFKLKLGNMTVEAYDRKLLELMKYADFVRDEKEKYRGL